MWHVLNMACFHFTRVYMHACVCKIDVIEVLAHLHTRCVYNNLREHACMSGKYLPDQVCIHLDLYMSYQLRMTI